jgi:MFS family permease
MSRSSQGGASQVSDPEEHAERSATFREVLASGEYRAIFTAGALSIFGDSMARAAVTALVYHHTRSVLAASATFAISYLPWLGFGPLLTALAERYPYRRTMIVCDVARVVTIGLVAVPGVPVPALLFLLLLSAMFEPPFRAARSALTAHVLKGDRYVVGIAMQETSGQVALVSGYFLGGTLAVLSPRLTIGFDALTFAVSACLIGLWIRHREPALRPERRTHLLRESAEGFRLVFGQPVLRSIAVVVFAALLFSIVPEGLGAAWADVLSPHNPRAQGWMQGLIMCSMPLGFTIGSLSINRLVRPATRQKLIRPFAVVIPLSLSAAFFSPPIWGVSLIAAVTGFATAALTPAANGLFVQVLPDEFRARAFGVMLAGVQLSQGAGVFVTGALANHFDLTRVVGLWGAAGVVVMLLVTLTWPRPEVISDAVAGARHEHTAETPAPTRRPSPGPAIRRQPPINGASGPGGTDGLNGNSGPTATVVINGSGGSAGPAAATGPRHAAPEPIGPDHPGGGYREPDPARRPRHAAPEEPAADVADDAPTGRHAAAPVDPADDRAERTAFWRRPAAGTRAGGEAGRIEG